MPNWAVTVRYDTQNDLIYVRWNRQDLLGNWDKGGETAFGYLDLEDALAKVQRVVRTLGAPRLF